MIDCNGFLILTSCSKAGQIWIAVFFMLMVSVRKKGIIAFAAIFLCSLKQIVCNASFKSALLLKTLRKSKTYAKGTKY